MRKIVLFLLFSIYSLSYSKSYKRISTQEYIDTYKNIAIKNMKTHRIPASITLAQGIHESGSGNSDLAIYANNHFGIKCHKEWTGEVFHKDDDAKDECFRKYPSAADSYDDHCYFLTTRDRYAFLFQYEITDYRSWAYGLKQAGYATNPKYPEVLLKIIEDNKLYLFDKLDNIEPLLKKDSSISNQKPIAVEVFTPSEIADFEPIQINSKKRPIFINNEILYIIARKGDTYKNLASEFEMFETEILRFNDIEKKHILKEGEIVYIKPKKRKAITFYHIVKNGESMHSISQYYGIKLKPLYKRNNMTFGSNPKNGQKLYLRKRKH